MQLAFLLASFSFSSSCVSPLDLGGPQLFCAAISLRCGFQRRTFSRKYNWESVNFVNEDSLQLEESSSGFTWHHHSPFHVLAFQNMFRFRTAEEDGRSIGIISIWLEFDLYDWLSTR